MTCSKCGADKFEDDFYDSLSSKTGKHKKCIICYKENQWANEVKRNYGISIEEYNRCMNSSVGCEICGRTEGLHYDHSHITGKFRGVLCNRCNRGIGMLGDSRQGVQQALNYLNRTGD